MASRREWSALSDGYRSRLERKGIDRAAYESGASLKSARGHKETPEHPRDAARRPADFTAYRVRNAKNINVLTDNGLRRVRLDKADRSKVAQHWNAARLWAKKGQSERINAMAGVTVQNVDTGENIPLAGASMDLYELALTGQMNVESIYVAA
ncbi:hypothetical protein O1L44_20820 [Streptomyces noursei]|uniref:hypothetical protein n=1 Tax=Streptomyces noursei TaxID=1971 RepID=UPI00081CDBE8|nr:hypothetical protein SNOUR_25200 [Streptomyces noursei ATCC 11455]MCZ0995064.1 hypothetical protein [Streptomyces noursei]